VEPEVLLDGDHTIERCYQVTAGTLVGVSTALREHRVQAEATVGCLRECVPASVPGVVFLSGGQSDQAATEHLNAINQLGPQPWQLSFSYGRALQTPALQAWRGDPAHVSAAQSAFYRRTRLNGAARLGQYRPEMEQTT
jgi:fructose-bisphosphate aldolase, class I